MTEESKKPTLKAIIAECEKYDEKRKLYFGQFETSEGNL